MKNLRHVVGEKFIHALKIREREPVKRCAGFFSPRDHRAIAGCSGEVAPRKSAIEVENRQRLRGERGVEAAQFLECEAANLARVRLRPRSAR